MNSLLKWIDSRATPINQTLVDEGNMQHAIYLARMRTKDSTSFTGVLVKFAVKYNAAAHRLLASHNPSLAPALCLCKRAINDMFIVAMEYIPKPEGTSFRNFPRLPPYNLKAIHQDLPQAFELPHKENLVFDHLRELNVLYLPDKDLRYSAH